MLLSYSLLKSFKLFKSSVFLRHPLCIVVVEIPYYNQSLDVGLEVRAALVDVGVSFKGSKLSVAVCLGLVVGDWSSGLHKKTYVCKGFGLLVVCPREV